MHLWCAAASGLRERNADAIAEMEKKLIMPCAERTNIHTHLLSWHQALCVSVIVSRCFYCPRSAPKSPDAVAALDLPSSGVCI
jgi:hypothetical protein